MKQDIIIPRMGESISEAHIGKIFKVSGSQVKADEEIVELETDKVNQVLYAPASGLLTLHVKPQDVVKIEQVIGFVDTEGAAPPAPQKETPPPTETARIHKDDFFANIAKEPEKVAEPRPAISVEASGRKKMSRLRQTIATRLVEAKSQTAMLTTFNEVDLTEIVALRERHKEAFQKKYGVKLGYMPFFVKACLSGLKEFPLLNAFIEGDEIVEKNSIDISIAVSTDRGLVVPVIKNAEHLSFAEIELALAALTKKAREGQLAIDELRGGTFTITNGGSFGSLLSTPILNFPQSSILGMHKIQKRPVVIDDRIEIRSMMYLALTYDHRLIDGREAVLFLVHVKNMLEDTGRFLIEV